MNQLEIIKFPNPILRSVCAAIKHMDTEMLTFISDLKHFMYRQPGGIGIAAPQVGVNVRLAIVDVSAKDKTKTARVLINPSIIEGCDPISFREGCMSVPDFTANVRRFNRIKFKWQDENLKVQTAETSGIEAICIQHEIDHLNGLLFLHRVSSLKNDIFRRKKYLK